LTVDWADDELATVCEPAAEDPTVETAEDEPDAAVAVGATASVAVSVAVWAAPGELVAEAALPLLTCAATVPVDWETAVAVDVIAASVAELVAVAWTVVLPGGAWAVLGVELAGEDWVLEP